MTAELGTWLRAQREERSWTRADTARKLTSAARQAGENGLPDVDTLRKNIYRWESGQTDVSERYRLLYCRVLGIKAAQFGPQEAAAPDAGAYHRAEGPVSEEPTVRQEVLMAAHEGSEQAARAEEHGIGDATLEQLRADLVRLAHETDTGQPFTVFLELRRVRERIYQLLDRRLWPGQQADLYFILGGLNGLMGVAADRLGYPDSAEELLRAGWAYATAIDHRPLLAALRIRLSSVAFWRGQYRQALALATDGVRYATAGPAAAELHLKYAQAAAQLGDTDAARRAVTAAHEARDRGQIDELVEIGGEFSLSRASHHYFAGAALIGLDGAERESAAEIERAVVLYAAGPGQGEMYSFEARARAGADLAIVHLRSGALDAAAVALESVLVLPPPHRVTSVVTRMRLVRAEFAAPVFRGSAQARELDERIEDFARDSAAAGLRSLSDGPA